jgi:hypothetical protein
MIVLERCAGVQGEETAGLRTIIDAWRLIVDVGNLHELRIHHVVGLTGDRTAFVTTRPCRAPHHTISDVGLIGGGHVLMPGEVSLAHHCVRFLDERPECCCHVLDVLRSRWRRASQQYNLPHVLNLHILAE